MTYYGIIPFRKPKSISTGKLVLLMASFPLMLAALFVLAYILSNYVLCPLMLNLKPLCGGSFDMGMLLAVFFAFAVIASIIFFATVIRRFSSPENLENLPQYQKANDAMMQMLRDAQAAQDALEK